MLKQTTKSLYLVSKTVAWGLAIYFLIGALAFPVAAPVYAEMTHTTIPTIWIILGCIMYAALSGASWLVTKRNVYAVLVLCGLFAFVAYSAASHGALVAACLFLFLLTAIAAPFILTAAARRLASENN